MSILRYSRKSVTEGFSEAPVLFPGFPGAMSGTRAAKLWGKSCKMVNHPPAPPKSASTLSCHRNRREMGQRSPPCDSWDTATMGEIPPTWVHGRMGCAPHAVLSFFPQNTCSWPKHSARTGCDAQARGEIQGGLAGRNGAQSVVSATVVSALSGMSHSQARRERRRMDGHWELVT